MRTNHHPSDENISTKTSDWGEQFHSADTTRNRELSLNEGGKSPNKFTTEGNTSTEAGGDNFPVQSPRKLKIGNKFLVQT